MGTVEARHKRLLLPLDLIWVGLGDNKALPFPNLMATTANMKGSVFILTPAIGFRLLDEEKCRRNTPAGQMELVRSYRSISFGLPTNRGGSAPALSVSGPAQRLLTLRPARSPGRLCDPLHQRLQQFRCLHRCSDCYAVERTSSRAGIPPLWIIASHGAPGYPTTQGLTSPLSQPLQLPGSSRSCRPAACEAQQLEIALLVAHESF